MCRPYYYRTLEFESSSPNFPPSTGKQYQKKIWLGFTATVSCHRPSTRSSSLQLLRWPYLLLSKAGSDKVKYLVTYEMMACVWARLRDSLSALNSSSSNNECHCRLCSTFLWHGCDAHVSQKTVSNTRESICQMSLSEFFSLLRSCLLSSCCETVRPWHLVAPK